MNAIAGAGTANDVNLTTTKGYDAQGDLTDQTDPTGVVTHYGFDRGGRITASTLNYSPGTPGSTATVNVTSRLGYNDRGELTIMCAAQQVQIDGCDPAAGSAPTSSWRYAYDAAGHVVTDTPPANAGTALVTTTSVYDTANGGARLTSSCDATSGGCSTPSRHTEYTYDELGRLVDATTYQGSGTTTPKVRTVTAYDGASERTAITSYENGSGPRPPTRSTSGSTSSVATRRSPAPVPP